MTPTPASAVVTAPVPLYRFYVEHPSRGEIPVGVFYSDKETAKGWRSFVKSAWRGQPTRLVHAASLVAPAASGAAR